MSFKDWLAKRRAKKEAKKAAAPVKKAEKAPKSYAASVSLGDSNLAKAIKRGAEVVDAKLAAGKIDAATAKAKFDGFMSYKDKIGTAGEEAATIEVAQMIGFLSKA